MKKLLTLALSLIVVLLTLISCSANGDSVDDYNPITGIYQQAEYLGQTYDGAQVYVILQGEYAILLVAEDSNLVRATLVKGYEGLCSKHDVPVIIANGREHIVDLSRPDKNIILDGMPCGD